MTDIFGFLQGVPPYDANETGIYRLNQRHRLIIAPFADELKGARVLDLACHDGRWSYALAAAGAREVIGVEARQELIDRFDKFPNDPDKAKVALRCGDIFDVLEDMVRAGELFDAVAVYGIFYHVMDHMRLLKLCRQLGPKIIIIDSEFIENDNGMIQLVHEDTTNELNAMQSAPDVTTTVIGIPSQKATEMMAESLGYDVLWIDKYGLLGSDRRGMHDYFREGRKVRSTCALCSPDA